MKRNLGIFVCALAGLVLASGVLAATDEVFSVNVVGFEKQGVVQGLQINANPFESISLRDAFGTSGSNGTSQTAADNVMLYDAGIQNYVVYYLRTNAAAGRLDWRSGTTWGTNVYIVAGQAAFYRNRSHLPNTNVVAGDVVLTGAETNTVVQGLQLLSYPFSTPVLMGDLNLKFGSNGTSQTAADNISLYDSTIQNYVVYYLRTNAAAGRLDWRSGTIWATNIYVDMGKGFFFRSRKNGTYQWVETNKYLGSL